MSTTNSKSVTLSVVEAEAIMDGFYSHAALKNLLEPRIKAAKTPETRTFVTVGGRKYDIPGLKGVKWFPYNQLCEMGLKRTYGLVANGRWLPVNATGAIIPGYSWKGVSNKPVLTHEAR